jgi:hypothetical protein
LEKNKEIKFRLHAMSLDYLLIKDVKEINKQIDKDLRLENFEIAIETGGQDSFFWDKNIVQNNLTIKFSYDHEEKLILLAESKTSFDFIFENLQSYKVGKSSNNLPTNLLVAFRSISYSTTRGILYSKFSDTYLNRFFLPLIDPKQFMPKESTKKESEKNKESV